MIRKVASPKLLQSFTKSYQILPFRNTIPIITTPAYNYGVFATQKFMFSDQKNQKKNDNKNNKDKKPEPESKEGENTPKSFK